MNKDLKADLDALGKLAYHRKERLGGIVKAWHRSRKRLFAHPHFAISSTAYRWLFVPFTLWPIDIHGLVLYLLETLQKSKELESEMLMLLRLLGEPPQSAVCEAIAKQEFLVQDGNYDGLIKSQHKFDEFEERLSKNERFREEWNAIKSRWDVSQFENRSGVIRRRMVQERGFRTGWEFNWCDKKSSFQSVFDAFCQRWDLYGILHDKPLLLKFTINLTPHGTMIVVPRYWSFDARRDLRWRAVSKLHRSHGGHRQGLKLIQNRRERQKEAASAKLFHEEATKLGMRGASRNRYIMDKLNWHPATDISRLQRLLKQAV